MRLSASKALLLAAMTVAPLAASAQLSYNIGAVSLYKYRGIDVDNRAPKNFIPAIQGGVDYAFTNGLYVGNWNSTGKFGDANFEVDLYGGYKGAITENFGFDVGFVRYIYPRQGSFNGNEVYVGLSYGPVSAMVYRGVSGSIDKATYMTLGFEQSLTDALTFSVSLGVTNPDGPGNNFNDYSLGVSYDLGDDLAVSATVAGANKRAITGDRGKSRLILGVSKSF